MDFGTVVIGGGSGFIGRAIARSLKQIGYDVLIISRQPGLHSISWTDLVNEGLPNNCTAVINVAGQNVFAPARRRTAGFQRNIYESRVQTTKVLAEQIEKMSNPPKVFGIISGVGYYTPSETESCTEDSLGGNHNFFSELCESWEKASILPPHLKVRRFVVRTGVVLGRSGGIINHMYWPFYFGLGGPIASGKQYMPWIHIEDMAGIFVHGIQSDSVEGVLNGVAPQIITNKEFTQAFASAMWRPAIFPVPAFILNVAFGKEAAAMMTEGLKVIPNRTLESGYKYIYPEIKNACKECVNAF